MKILNKRELIISSILSVFFVIFMWGFWEKGILALGFNLSVFGLLFLAYYLAGINSPKDFIKKNLLWLVPISLVILSYSIYDNPYLKTINTFLFPVFILGFLSYGVTKLDQVKHLSIKIIYKIGARKYYLKNALKALIANVNQGSMSQVIIKKILIGIVLLLIINSVIIALLIGADNDFGKIISNLAKHLDFSIFVKIFVAIIILIVLTTLKLSWKEEHIITTDGKEKQIDSIISGIVLGGTLITYLVFIFVQIDSVLISTLPKNIVDVANLVKNGFRQLFFVSIINIVFFFVYYRKTNDIVQKLMIAFIFASIIILISAGSKMFMYVTNYGFSYEKFTASYTVIYFGILFLTMVSILFIRKKVDILKIAISLALIMYSLLNIIPMEVMILKTNLAVSQKEYSRMNIYQTHMLSTDILASVRKLRGTPLFEEQSRQERIDKKQKKMEEKKRYEKNLSDL